MIRLFRKARSAAALVSTALTLFGSPDPANATQVQEAYVVGRVLDATSGEAVAAAQLTIEGTDLRTLSGPDGTFRLGPVSAGPRVLEVRRLGYATLRIPLEVPSEGTVERDVRLAVSALRVEGITVTADLAGRARGELGTATVLGREAILAQSAASLSGLLELVPGTPLSAPGLDNIQQASLRAVPTPSAVGGAWSTGVSASQLAAFGTLIVVDGVPLSNNANMQTGGLGFPTTVGGGIDLRRIPAATIERVEVIRGVPSARFGDLTQGAIVVETRAGEVPLGVAGRLDRRTGASSLTGGWALGDHALSVSGDVARTRVEPGVSPDESTRYTLQLAHRAARGAAGDGRDLLVMDTRADVFRMVEDQPENPDLFPGRARWMRDAGLRLSHRLRWARPTGSVSFLVALDMNRQEAYSQRFLTRTAMPVTDRLEEGRAEGEYLEGRFLAQSDVDGAPRFLFGRLEREIGAGWLGMRHEIRTGVQFRREWNAGSGLDFDPRFPPQLTFTGVRGHDRPRRLDAVSPLTVTSAYFDDRLTRGSTPFGSFSLQAGLRADALHEEGKLGGGVRDVVLQPRLNAEVQPWAWLRVRAGWGIAAKTPSMLQLSPAPEYYDLVNLNWFTDQPEERRAILTTFVRDGTNPDLGFSRARMAEAGVEVGFSRGEGIVSITAFRETIQDGVGMRSLPGFLPREHFQLADSTIGTGVPPEIIEPAYRVDTVPLLVSQPANHLELVSHGMEVVASLPEIEALRTRIQLQGAWTWTRLNDEDYDYGPVGRFSDFQHRHVRERIPIWDSPERQGERGLLTYRVIHHQPAVGLVITASVQHDLYERDFTDASGDPTEWVGYLTRSGERVFVPPAERDRPEFQDLRDTSRGVPPREQSAPADWILSIQATKTLAGDGRVSFWAFNVLDNLGHFFDGETRARPYPGIRFGMEMNLPLNGLGIW